MLKKHNQILISLFIVISLLIIRFGNTLQSKVIIFVIGFVVFILLNHLFTKEILAEKDKIVNQIKNNAKKQSKEYEEKMNQIITSIPSALVYINQRGEFDVFNRKFSLILGTNAKNVYDSNMNTDVRQMLLDAFINEKQFIRQEKFNDIDYQVLSVPMMKDNRYNGCMIIMQDITRILEGEKIQSQFLSDTSFILKSPIDSIKRKIEHINSGEEIEEELLLEYFAQIQIETARLEQIVKDLLLKSRITEDQLHLEKTEFNLKQFFDGLIYEKRRQLHRSNIEVVLNCPSDVVIVADHFRLSQVFTNLFNNAINYAKNGSIKIDCNISRREWEIRFCDTGKGIPEDILPNIFKRFYKGDHVEEEFHDNAGLGLAISRKIIEAHDGTIEVESELGKGTCFIVNINPTDLSY